MLIIWEMTAASYSPCNFASNDILNINFRCCKINKKGAPNEGIANIYIHHMWHWILYTSYTSRFVCILLEFQLKHNIRVAVSH